jgi:hypothetical protein
MALMKLWGCFRKAKAARGPQAEDPEEFRQVDTLVTIPACASNQIPALQPASFKNVSFPKMSCFFAGQRLYWKHGIKTLRTLRTTLQACQANTSLLL